ncbi:MAG TPA: ATP-dependent helicase, partial [Parachlamydiaceae bacterium]|nr:ATP-dependent helicase [Parachlamydiaceae bacterium]
NGVDQGDPSYAEVADKIPSKARKGIEDFIGIINTAKAKFANQSLQDSMMWLIEKINYKKAISEEVKSTQMRDFKWENVQEFVSSMAEFEQKTTSENNAKPTLQDYVLGTALDGGWEGSASKQQGEDKVSLMTIHSSKGLEFPACFLIGMEDHIIPHEKSLKQTGIEEERRLMYVALTRSMKYLTLSMARQRKRMGVDALSAPSRFILEIPKEHLKMTNWHQLD